MNHQKLVSEISKELYEDENVLALMLYGSVSRYEESDNSDIDLLDTNDEIAFNYLISLLITTAIPFLNEIFGLWPKTRRGILCGL